jgi:hypothetical protein
MHKKIQNSALDYKHEFQDLKEEFELESYLNVKLES